MTTPPAPSVAPPTPASWPRSRFAGRRRVVLILTAVFALLVPLTVDASQAQAQTTGESRISSVVLSMINAERHVHGLPYVHSNSHLVLSARRHNLTMARYNTMSHQLPHEAYFASRMTTAGYHWRWAGENIAWNSQMTTAGVVALQKMMYNEKAPDNGHRLNILSRHFKDVGVDVYLDYRHHKIWLTTDFGSRS